jgi:hypothetical protein
MRGGSLLVLALVSGCGFEAVHDQINVDLAGVDLAGADFAGVDLAGIDLAGVDLAVPPGSDLAVNDMAQTPCVGPLLLVTVENVHNGATGGGRVHVMSLGDGTMPPADCKTLSAQGQMTPQPFSTAMVKGKLAVMGIDGFQLVDPSSDLALWSKPVGNNDFPVDVFALKHPDGRDVIAFGWATIQSCPSCEIAHLDGYGLDGGLIKTWNLGTDLMLSSVLSMSSHPKMPTHLFALDPTHSEWGWDVDPWGATKVSGFGNASGIPLSIYSDLWTSLMRTVWVDSTSPTRIYYSNDSSSGFFGPIICTTGCTMLHAVPDPNSNVRFFGLCDGPSVDARRVVWFSSVSSDCNTILEGAKFGSESRLSRLAISE